MASSRGTGSADLRFLAPHEPGWRGRSVSIRISVRGAQGGALTWGWEDGPPSVQQLPLDGRQRLVVRHRYPRIGVYRVSVALTQSSVDRRAWRYVGVRGSRRDVAGCGVVVGESDDPVRTARFGFVLQRPRPAAIGGVHIRWEVRGGEARSNDLGWLLTDAAGGLHFGGTAYVDGDPVPYRYRVDAQPLRPGGAWWLALSLYAPGQHPGQDSPMERVGGTVRRGTITGP